MKSIAHILLEKLVAHRPARALLLSARQVGVNRMTLRLPEGSPLFRRDGGELLEFPVDAVMAQSILRDGAWSIEEVQFAVAHAPKGPLVLFDIGANIGLMTRQLIHALPNIVAAVCYEPHPLNFSLLSRNLAHFENCQLIPSAVGATAGRLSFYEDLHNAGNYSLSLDAMRGREYRTSAVDCLRSHDDEFLSRLPLATANLPIIWKSDAQGVDEAIATSLSAGFWCRVSVALIELTRIARPAFSAARLAGILELFPIRRYVEGSERQLSVAEILQHTSGSDGRHRELLLAKS